MTIDQLRATLEAVGWRIDKPPLPGEMNECDWYAWLPKRPDDWPDCECNDKPPSLTLQPHVFTHNGATHSSCEFRLCGEASGRWFDLKLYSVKLDEVMQTIPHAVASLGAAWTAIANMKEKT